jgi:hypothetical protein
MKKPKVRYGYQNRGTGLTVVDGWKLYDKPLNGKQYGFFGTLKSGKFGEITWGEGDELHHKRAFNSKDLFGWLHDNVFIPFWGDMRIEEIKENGAINTKRHKRH